VICEDDRAIVFLNKYPVLAGYTLVAPKAHLTEVTGDFSETAYLELQRLIWQVGGGRWAPSASTSPRWAAARPTPTCTGTWRRCRRTCR
jgi:hypothetical protein